MHIASTWHAKPCITWTAEWQSCQIIGTTTCFHNISAVPYYSTRFTSTLRLTKPAVCLIMKAGFAGNCIHTIYWRDGTQLNVNGRKVKGNQHGRKSTLRSRIGLMGNRGMGWRNDHWWYIYDQHIALYCWPLLTCVVVFGWCSAAN
jgi:hypothetical protein